ncbi:unnamed protein product, partial [Didymodactylos carnosus]
MFFILFVYLLHLISLCITQPTSYTCDPLSSCGCSKERAVLSKIVGGEPAVPHSWGWIVSFRRYLDHKCGGAVLNENYVITAAHCIDDINTIISNTVSVGKHQLSRSGQIRSISKVFVHPYYKKSTFENDIAVLQLSSPLNLSDPLVSKICLPNLTETTSFDVPEYPRVNSSLVVVGWGRLLFRNDSLPDILQQVTVRAISKNHHMCSESIQNPDIQFCAGIDNGGKDSCQGDSGGPLMLFSNNRWELVGIVSFGNECALPNHAGIYTRVAAYQNWIKNILEKGIDVLDTTTPISILKTTTTNSYPINSKIYKCNSSAQCGCSKNWAVLSKIVGGEIARPNTWGWIASIRRNSLHICGGSILNKNYVITAAHCLNFDVL